MLIRNNLWQTLNEEDILLRTNLNSKISNDSNKSTRYLTPTADAKESENLFLLLIDLPGIDPARIEISVDESILTVKGSRLDPTTEDKNNYHLYEREKGTFVRRFKLPETADLNQVTAKSQHGVLEVSIGKKIKENARIIPVLSH